MTTLHTSSTLCSVPSVILTWQGHNSGWVQLATFSDPTSSEQLNILGENQTELTGFTINSWLQLQWALNAPLVNPHFSFKFDFLHSKSLVYYFLSFFQPPTPVALCFLLMISFFNSLRKQEPSERNPFNFRPPTPQWTTPIRKFSQVKWRKGDPFKATPSLML